MNEIRKDLPAMVEKMPAFSQSVHRVIQLAPFLMMRILKLVNSPYFGLIP
jgi:HD-like signal output (HDOD) protein